MLLDLEWTVFPLKIGEVKGINTPQRNSSLENTLRSNGKYNFVGINICVPFLTTTFHVFRASQANVRAARQLWLKLIEDSLLKDVCSVPTSREKSQS